jgi:5'(3')-deoxyribonucleotidase
MRKKIVAVDMDDTILWLMKEIMKDHNDRFPDHLLEYKDMIAFDESMMHPEYNKMNFFEKPGSFRNLEIMDEYVVDELRKINQDYDLIIVTSAFAHSVPDKWEWLQEHLPFITKDKFITASRKYLINADILIDDAIHNVLDWTTTGRPAIVPSHHWNQKLLTLNNNRITMIYGWHGVKEIVDNILK